MAKKSPVLYSVSKTFVWFALVSILLTACLAGIVWTDYNREWKGYQKKFVRLKMDQARNDLKKSEQGLDQSRLSELQAALKAAEAEFASHKSAFNALQKDIDALSTPIAKARTVFQEYKQFEDSYKYYFEEYRLHKNPEAAHYEKKLKDLALILKKAKEELETLEKRRDDLLARQQTLEVEKKRAKKAVDQHLDEKTRIEKKMQALQPTIVKDVLNAPMLDFVAPTLRVQQIVLDTLQDDYHFAKVQKVDRCVTCHLGIDQKGFEDAPQPFRTHPKLDLYLGTSSKHPMEKIGCTVCHGGNGHSVSFLDTAHTPRDEHQGKEWAKKHGWRELEKWEHKMLPSRHIEASCVKCHAGVVEVPQASKLNRGRKLAETMGCLNCHKVKGYEDRWKVGPDLRSVSSKLSDEWIRKWLDNPRDFRPSTQMPRVFHLSNTSSPEDIEKNKAAIISIEAYLSQNSDPVELPAVKLSGDKDRGEKLVKSLGCLGCHSVAGQGDAHFGPELSGLGSKVQASWLQAWLKNPKHYSPETRMPSLRLSDEEAADITAYLLSLKNDAFDKKADVHVEPAVIDSQVMTLLQGTMRKAEAEQELAGMSAQERLQYLGKKSISHQGCFTCHSIKGFETAKPIGAELSDEGRKDIHQFDFGFAHIPHTRHDFIEQKIKDPRIYDHGKEKAYYDKLRMPQFDMTPEDRDALTTFVLSLTEESMPLEAQRRLSAEEAETEKGRLLVSKLNCNGCHTLDGREGAIGKITEEPGQAPPVLDGEGAKVQEGWLNAFLKSPTVIRPWIEYRMPTFDLSEDELTVMNKYFNHLSHQEISYAGIVMPEASKESIDAGKGLFETFQCIKCHQLNAESAAMGSSFLAPDLTMTKHRLKAEWVRDWLADPQKIQEGTMMPTYFVDGQTPVADVLKGETAAQIAAIRDYLYRYEKSLEKTAASPTSPAGDAEAKDKSIANA